MSPTQNRLRLRLRPGIASRTTIAFSVTALGFALFLTVPSSTLRASTDCSSLGVELQDSAEFTKVECDEGSFQHGDLFGSYEDISARNSHSVYAVRHEIAGTHTYIIRTDPQTMLGSSFSKSESWSTAPGGNGFSVARFKGWLKGYPDFPFSFFGFVRYSGHVNQSTGYRHGLFGFYCDTQTDGISDAETNRLIQALQLHFE